MCVNKVMNTSVGVVIPAYKPDLSLLTDYISSIQSTLSPEIIRIEMDSPSPKSVEILSEYDVDISTSQNRRGKGAAIMAGFDALDTDIHIFTDADGSVPTSSLGRVLQPILKSTADVSIGSRRHPDSIIINHQTVLRRFLGEVFARGARYLLPTQCMDYQCGAKAVTADAWSSIGHHCYEPGFAWDLEFVSVAGSLGHKITEVPITWEDHPDSSVAPISTSIELATALIDVKRRTDAIAVSPRYHDVETTDKSEMLEKGWDDN